jgi:P-type Mg2+ transporter
VLSLLFCARTLAAHLLNGAPTLNYISGSKSDVRNCEDEVLNSYWSQPTAGLVKQLQSTDRGLSSSDAAARLKQVGPNSLKAARRASALGLLLNQFKSPLVLILIVATIISAFVGEYTDALITFIILMSSALLSFFQEYRADTAITTANCRLGWLFDEH